MDSRFSSQAYWKVSEDKKAKCAEKGKSKQVISFASFRAHPGLSYLFDSPERPDFCGAAQAGCPALRMLPGLLTSSRLILQVTSLFPSGEPGALSASAKHTRL